MLTGGSTYVVGQMTMLFSHRPYGIHRKRICPLQAAPLPNKHRTQPAGR